MLKGSSCRLACPRGRRQWDSPWNYPESQWGALRVWAECEVSYGNQKLRLAWLMRRKAVFWLLPKGSPRTCPRPVSPSSGRSQSTLKCYSAHKRFWKGIKCGLELVFKPCCYAFGGFRRKRFYSYPLWTLKMKSTWLSPLLLLTQLLKYISWI